MSSKSPVLRTKRSGSSCPRSSTSCTSAAFPHAPAARLRRRRGRSRHLVSRHGGVGQARRQHRLVHRPDERLRGHGLRRRAGSGAQDLGRAALSAELGTADQGPRRRGRRRPPRERRVDDVERQPARDLDRPHCPGVRQEGGPGADAAGLAVCTFFVPADPSHGSTLGT